MTRICTANHFAVNQKAGGATVLEITALYVAWIIKGKRSLFLTLVIGELFIDE